jgi:hypothetical protein
MVSMSFNFSACAFNCYYVSFVDVDLALLGLLPFIDFLQWPDPPRDLLLDFFFFFFGEIGLPPSSSLKRGSHDALLLLVLYLRSPSGTAVFGRPSLAWSAFICVIPFPSSSCEAVLLLYTIRLVGRPVCRLPP